MTIIETERTETDEALPPLDDETLEMLAESLFATIDFDQAPPAPSDQPPPLEVVEKVVEPPPDDWPGIRPLTVRALSTIVLGVAFGLRVANLDVVGLNSDEAVYAGQGGALLGVADLAQHFSIFRAHPLLLQLTVGSLYEVVGPNDHAARMLVAVVFGFGSVVLTMLLARDLFGVGPALIAGALVGVVPYHVIVSRQVLVDTPMAFFVLLALLVAARAKIDRRPHLLYLAFGAAALAALSKEIAVLLVVVLVWWLLTGEGRFRWPAVVGPSVLFALVTLPFPATRLVHQPGNASDFVLWQFTRAPNHDPDYFLRILLQFGGGWFLALAAVGLGVMVARRQPADRLVLIWLIVFGGFFQFWPTKLFPYLYVVLPALAMAGAVGVVEVVAFVHRRARLDMRVRPTLLVAAATIAVSASLGFGSAGIVLAGPAAELEGFGDFDVEVQSFAGGREVGEWARERTPDNARFVTLGPSLGNILRFYGGRDSVALSVSADPARRNPAYVPIINPDLAARQMAVHYIVWDAYSADRSAFYNGRLRAYARKHGGEIVFSAWAEGDDLMTSSGPPPDDVDVRIVVWDVPGAGPLGADVAPGGVS